MKQITYSLFLICLLLQSCKMSDVRTNYILSSYKDENRLISLLQKVESAYGGYENWKKIKAVTAVGYDEWPTFHWRVIASPWKDKKTNFTFTWIPNTDNSRITLLSGKQKGDRYGIQNWATYQQKDTTITFRKNKDIWFHLPTIEYFLEFPFRIREAEVIRYAGRKKVNEREYDLLFFTWKSEEPNKQMDQYLVYINPENYQIEYLELTVRDQAKWAFATVRYKNFKQEDQFMFPMNMEFYFQNKLPGKTLGHRISINKISIHQDYDQRKLVPNPGVVKTKF